MSKQAHYTATDIHLNPAHIVSNSVMENTKTVKESEPDA